MVINISELYNKIVNLHDNYSTIVGSTQPFFNNIAHRIQKSISYIWYSRPIEILSTKVNLTSEKFTQSTLQSTIIQNGLKKAALTLTNKSYLNPIKIHLLNKDPKIKRLKLKIENLEHKIQSAYCSLFEKPVYLDKMNFYFDEYNTLSKHFQEFLIQNRKEPNTLSTSATDLEGLIDFLENETLPNSETAKEKVIDLIESLVPSASISEDIKIKEAEEAFQNCYFLYLAKELLQKFEKGEVYKNDLLLFLKNYNISPDARFITEVSLDASIENVAEVGSGTIGEIIAENPLTVSLHDKINKKILGPILSLYPLTWIRGTFSSYLTTNLAGYVGIKLLGSNESLKDYIHKMTSATIAANLVGYGLEFYGITDPVYLFIITFISGHIGYNFTSFYQPLLQSKYLAENLKENYPQMIEILDKFLYEHIESFIEQMDNNDILEFKNIARNSVVQISREHQLDTESLLTNLDNYFNNKNIDLLRNKLKNLNQEEKNLLSPFSKNPMINFFISKFPNFYSKFIKEKDLLQKCYEHRELLIKASSTFSSNTTAQMMPDIKDILFEIGSILRSNEEKDKLFFICAKVNSLMPSSLFQLIAKKLETRLASKFHPLQKIDPIFLEILVKSFFVTNLIQGIDLSTIPKGKKDTLINQCKFIDCFLHMNLISQSDEKHQSLLRYMVYNIIHQEINTAIASVPALEIA